MPEVVPTWSAVMIAADSDFAGAPLLRREFDLDTGHGAVAAATLHATAYGVFEAFLAGRRVADDLLRPGWTSYRWRLRYCSYDVTELVGDTPGPLVLGLALGNGWYRGRLGWSGNRAFYGDELGGLAQLAVTFADGHVQTVVTDETWTAGPSPVTANDLYDGQTIDARLGSDDWLQAGFADPGWTGVHRLDLDPATLVPHTAPPVRRLLEVTPVASWILPTGRLLIDFGQNLVGWVRVQVQGPAGSTVRLRHAEVLEHDELGVRPLRSALATDTYLLSGGPDVFEPTFTFHGFRYAEVDGWPGGLDALRTDPGALTAVVIGSDLRRIGDFACSDDLLNQLHRNVVWSARGNFVDVPTDCPQRDERLGWTGDLAVFAPTAAYLFDVSAFLRDWLADLNCDQHAAHGRVPLVIPDVLNSGKLATDFGELDNIAVWGDVAVWAPWALYQAYGDTAVLADQFDSMTGYLRRVETLLSPNGLWETKQLGDWLDPTAPPEHADRAKADPSVVATACLYRSARLTAEAAAVLSRPGEAAEFRSLAERTRAAFTTHYVSADGRIRSDAQTGYALAIVFGLLDEPVRRRAGDRLAELVADSGHHIATGFAGTPYLTDALADTGHLDEAYRLLLEQGCPSWLYPITMGATTIWERWDSMLPDGTINPGQMTSFNHYALGAVADWMHRVIGGLAPLEPGYAKVLVAPRPGGELSWARTALDSPYGRIAVAWQQTAAGLHVDVDLPDGVTGILRLPGEPDRAL